MQRVARGLCVSGAGGDGHKEVHEKDLNGNRAEISTPKLNKN